MQKLGIFDKGKSSSAKAFLPFQENENSKENVLSIHSLRNPLHEENEGKNVKHVIHEPSKQESPSQSQSSYKNTPQNSISIIHQDTILKPSMNLIKNNSSSSSIHEAQEANDASSLSQSYQQDENGRCSPKTTKHHKLASFISSEDPLALFYRPYFR